MIKSSILLYEEGFETFIDCLIDSDEYNEVFGEYRRNRFAIMNCEKSFQNDFLLGAIFSLDRYAIEEASKILLNDPKLKHNVLMRRMLDEYWNRLISKTQLN